MTSGLLAKCLFIKLYFFMFFFVFLESMFFESHFFHPFLAHLAQSVRRPRRCRRQQLFQRSSSTKLLGQFQPNFTEMFIGWSPYRFLQIMKPGSKMAAPRGRISFS